ncbi:MAG TPA: choice-of-anchor D domain-containing protein [Methylibium sp.]|uniref:choice-of-anchor D domain-containing protein n=1 Tax=Methylibium sp. TaxID=2067992 RepID=UPI002DBFBA1D|nr:choice-of-anchor D domain-containing protein [Methylibium sp.]HEU4458589.1 choice-of-anchor D domain-containing protein [Methylibium sp.]
MPPAAVLPASRRLRNGLAGALAAAACNVALAQDAVRGAQLYLQLPGAASCVSCHGPDPSQGRNNLLRAADQPSALQRALGTVGVMGYLKPLLADADVADLAAYLGAVAAAASPAAPAVLWPVTIEFGGVALGAVSPVHTLSLRNVSGTSLALGAPQLAGVGAAGLLLDTDCAATLPAGAECRVRLRAQPAAAGPAAAAVVVTGITPRPWVVPLSYAGRSEPLGVLAVEPPDAVLDFGRTPVGASTVRSVRIVNRGTAEAALGVTALTGPGRDAFRFAAAQGAATPACGTGTLLAPGAACTATLSFASGAAGRFDAYLQWRGDATQPGGLLLAGEAEAAAPPAAPSATGAPAEAAPGDGGGAGCAAAPPARGQRLDPTLSVAAAIALLCLMSRGAVTRLSRRFHGAFTEPAYRPVASAVPGMPAALPFPSSRKDLPDEQAR